MLVEQMEEGKKQIVVYERPDNTILRMQSNDLLDAFFRYAECIGLNSEDVCFQKALIWRIILRVDMRKDYILCFHKTHINEIKQAALTAYWILKFKPFMFCGSALERFEKYRRINEGFAAFYIISSLNQAAIEKGTTIGELSDRLAKEIMYGLTYWNLSRQSIMLLAETIGDSYFHLEIEHSSSNEK